MNREAANLADMVLAYFAALDAGKPISRAILEGAAARVLCQANGVGVVRAPWLDRTPEGVE